MTREEFVVALGWIFEGSPWVAERAWSLRPFQDLESLHAALFSEVQSARREEQLALIRAHPDLGSRLRMAPASAEEQESAGLDRLSPADYSRLSDLTKSYRSRFGFPFLFAVKGSTPAAILEEIERRLGNSEDEELSEALRQIGRISRFRLETCVCDGER